MKLLVVEDNAQLQKNVQAYFSKEGYVSEYASSYSEAEQKLQSFEYDVVVLDLMLPDGNGLDLLSMLKDTSPSTGVLIISAKNSVQDRITGLDLGADDYLDKPFNLAELNARIKALFRRRVQKGTDLIHFQEMVVNTDTHEITVHGTQLILTRKEYELILYFVVNKNRVLTKQSIAEHLWGDYMDYIYSFDFVYQHVKNVRKKIKEAGGKDYIKTMYGIGYRLVESI